MDEATFTDRSQRLVTDHDYLLMDRRCFSMIANIYQQIGAVTD